MNRERKLRVEFLEERNLLAVSAGNEFLLLPQTESDSGAQVGDVHIESTIDIDGDGFIGPGDASYLSYAWFSFEGDENWLEECDIDGDGFIGPGDRSFVSCYWFETNDKLPDETKSYSIVPENLNNWSLTGSSPKIEMADAVLSLDSRNGTVAAVADFDEYGGNMRVTAEFQASVKTAGMKCGIEICVQDTGEYYYAQFGKTQTFLYYVEADGTERELSSASYTFDYSTWYAVWAQVKDGQVSCGVGDDVLIAVYESHLSGGKVGFRADRGVDLFTNISVEREPEQVTLPAKDTYVIVSSGTAMLTMTQFPDVCRLDDGSLMAVFYVGYDHVSYPTSSCPNGGRICASYSYDEGHTWTTLKTIIDTPFDDRDPSIVQLEDGRILCNFFVLDSDKSGNTLLVTKIAESSDGGKTWSVPVTVYTGYATSSPIRVLSNGTLLLPLYRQADGTAWGAVGISYDQGKTWSAPVKIPNGQYRLDAETDIIERNDGSLYAIERYQMGYSISQDGGKSWSVSEDVGFSGEAPYLFRTSKGAVVMAYRDNGKTVIRISLDDCKTWGKTILVDNCQGAYPSIAERNDGSLLILYYEGGTTYPNSKIRAKTFTVDSKGNVTWNLL